MHSSPVDPSLVLIILTVSSKKSWTTWIRSCSSWCLFYSYLRSCTIFSSANWSKMTKKDPQYGPTFGTVGTRNFTPYGAKVLRLTQHSPCSFQVYIMALGEFNDDAWVSDQSRIVFSLLILTVLIMMMNILIALVSDSYADAMNRSGSVFWRSRVDLIAGTAPGCEGTIFNTYFRGEHLTKASTF